MMSTAIYLLYLCIIQDDEYKDENEKEAGTAQRR